MPRLLVQIDLLGGRGEEYQFKLDRSRANRVQDRQASKKPHRPQQQSAADACRL